MIVYSITYQVDTGISDIWFQWLQEIHLPRVMRSGRFFRYTLQELIEPRPLPGTHTVNLQLYTLEINSLYTYWDEDVEILEGVMTERFGDQVSYFETVMRRLLQPIK